MQEYRTANSRDMLYNFMDIPNQPNPNNMEPGSTRYYKSDHTLTPGELSPDVFSNDCFNTLLTSSLYKNPINNYTARPEQATYVQQNPIMIPPSSRFTCIVNAPTSISQKLEEFTTTYLNRGQNYLISVHDNLKANEDFEITAILTFHDQNQRQRSVSNWQFWLLQQHEIQKTHALNIDVAKSSGVIGDVYNSKVDRLSIKVNLSESAKLCLKFNVLSTDFSRVKGIKGISLGIILEIKPINRRNTFTEYFYCKTKLFRDKGAERKNKDNQKQLEKILFKLQSSTEGSYHAKRYLDQFREPAKFTSLVPLKMDNETIRLIEGCSIDEKSLLLCSPFPKSDLAIQIGNDQTIYGDSGNMDYTKNKGVPNVEPSIVTVYDKDKIPSKILVDGIDPTFVPQNTRPLALLCIFVKYPNNERYRAIYLHELSLNGLLKAIFPFLPNNGSDCIYQDVYRLTKTGHCVIFGDEAVKNMHNEQDIILEIESVQNTSSYIIKLIY